MKKLTLIILPVIMIGCVVGPNFKNPPVETPPKFAYDTLVKADSNAVISIQWWESFGDTILTQLIDTAIKNNKNLAIALSNVEQARLKAKSVKAEMLPTFGINIGASYNYQYNTKLTQQYSAMLSVSWDIDLFGKLKRMSEASQNQYFASEFGRQATQLALTAEVATTYFSLLQYQSNLEISQQTYKTRAESTIMMDSMFFYGAISQVDLEQAKASTQTAKVAVEQYDRAVKQTMLALNLLLGQNPDKFQTGQLPDSVKVFEIPVGLPSSLLERRPDVMQAFYLVAAANANIGVAIANRLPSLSLTGQGGLLSIFERDLTSGMPIGWSATGSLVQPLLNWGNNKRAVEIAREQTKVATLNYQQTALNAINEVEQALIAIDTYKRQLIAAKQLMTSAKTAQYLTKELYTNGSQSYLDLLDADRTLFSAQAQYWETAQNYMSAYVSLYKALGGGWEQSNL